MPERKKEFFPNYKNTLEKKIQFRSKYSYKHVLGGPRPQELSHCLCLSEPSTLPIALYSSSPQSDHPAQSTHYSRRTATQPLLRETLSSHLTGSHYSEAAMDSQHSALWRGMLFVPKNPGMSQDHWVNTLFISMLPKHTNKSSGNSTWSMLAAMREHSSDNTGDRKVELGKSRA